MSTTNKTQEQQAEIIKTCKIQENNISADNIAANGGKKSTGQDTAKKKTTSLSLKPDVVQKLDSAAKACHMSKTGFVSRLIIDSESRIVSFPESGEILLKLARCYQILSDIRDNKDNNILPDWLEEVTKSLEKAESAMVGICYKIDALLPDIDDEEVDDNDL